MVSGLSVSGSETYLVIAYTKLSLCLTISLIRIRVTSLDSQLLGIYMRRNTVNKWAWRKRFRFSTTFCVPISGLSAVCDGVSAYRKRLALARAQWHHALCNPAVASSSDSVANGEHFARPW